ncbi:DsbA family protein [Parabacteroides sp. OttesenSCG-928-G21]|nr:DsbA family protein [Parabacteroides sp. OttesenSCG-928-G21]
MAKTANNPLSCDPQSGFCEIPTSSDVTDKEKIPAKEKPIRVIYFTDPICSACWGIEPQLRKMKLEYGDAVEIDYHMGGLLPDWSYNDGTINGPASVAHHWEEASQYYDKRVCRVERDIST